jgi:hypothetical protein
VLELCLKHAAARAPIPRSPSRPVNARRYGYALSLLLMSCGYLYRNPTLGCTTSDTMIWVRMRSPLCDGVAVNAPLTKHRLDALTLTTQV